MKPRQKNRIFAQRLRAAREAAGLHQEDIAERLNVAQSTISYWESGRRTLGMDDIEAYANLLHLDIAALQREVNEEAELLNHNG